MMGSIFAFANLHAVRLTIRAVAVPSRVANIEMIAMIPAARLLSITIILSMLVGLALAAPIDDWTLVSMVRHGVPFGEIEGYLDRDLGFYVYWLPLEETLYIWAMMTIVSMVAIVMVLYALMRTLRFDGRRMKVSTHVRRHLSVLGACVLLLLAWNYRLDAFDLLRSGSGPDGLFLRVDHVVTLRVDLVLSILCGVASLLVLRAGWFGQLRIAFVTVSVVLFAAVGLRHTLPSFLARGDLIGNQSTRDIGYQATRTLVSRRAYDVDGIRIVGSKLTSAKTVRMPASEISRYASLWDASAVREHMQGGNRAARNLVTPGFMSVENGSIGTLFAKPVAPGAEEWSVRSAIVSRPVLRDSSIYLRLTSVADGDDARPGQPIVAPGYTHHVLIVDSADVILGTRLTGFASRIAHAWAMRDPSIITDDSSSAPEIKFVSHRDVRERVRLLAPLFAQGSQVTPLVADEVLYWVLDLYSSSDSYPLSQRWMIAGDVRSYFRHSATAVINAATGRVQLLPVANPDPIARTWMSLEPTLFTSAANLAPALVTQLPPATDGAIAQLRTFARYGSRSEGPVLRLVADSALAGDGPPPHLVDTPFGHELAWSVPLLESGEQLSGIITAVGGVTMATYWDSTSTPRSRWTAMTEQLRLALDSSRTGLSEIARRERQVKSGRVQSIMLEYGPLLLQPLYWNRGDGTVVVARVAVLFEGRIGVGMSAYDALSRVGLAGYADSMSQNDTESLVESQDAAVSRLYDVMRQAVRRGDWARFGSAFDSLGIFLGKPPM